MVERVDVTAPRGIAATKCSVVSRMRTAARGIRNRISRVCVLVVQSDALPFCQTTASVSLVQPAALAWRSAGQRPAKPTERKMSPEEGRHNNTLAVARLHIPCSGYRALSGCTAMGPHTQGVALRYCIAAVFRLPKTLSLARNMLGSIPTMRPIKGRGLVRAACYSSSLVSFTSWPATMLTRSVTVLPFALVAVAV